MVYYSNGWKGGGGVKSTVIKGEMMLLSLESNENLNQCIINRLTIYQEIL